MSPNGVLAGAHVIAQNSPLAISLLRSREGLYRGAWRMTRQSVFCVLCSCFGVGVVVCGYSLRCPEHFPRDGASLEMVNVGTLFFPQYLDWCNDEFGVFW